MMMEFGFYFRLLLLFSLVLCSCADFEIHFQLVRYQSFGKNWDGQSCDHLFNKPCDVWLWVCLDKEGVDESFNSCSFKKYKTQHYQDRNDIYFPENVGHGNANPIELKFTRRWLGGMRLKVEANDHDTLKKDGLIDRLMQNLHFPPARGIRTAQWQSVAIRGMRQSSKSQLQIAYRVFCSHNYYDKDCFSYCKATENYTCNPETGMKVCKSGMEGPDCKTKSDDCMGVNCHHGECIDQSRNFTCSCADGWQGRYCNQSINECLSNPCQNHGVCFDLENGFRCGCPSSYTGKFCELHICSKNVIHCLHYGQCYGNGTCFCLEGFSGIHCEINSCDYLQCANNAKCSEGKCHCVDGFTGGLCKLDPCADIHCGNGSSCLSVNGSWQCQCTEGYTGRLCDHSIDDCNPNPCKKESTCIDGHLDFHCLCLAGYGNKTCDVIIEDYTNIKFRPVPLIAEETHHFNSWGILFVVLALLIVIILLVIALMVRRRRGKSSAAGIYSSPDSVIFQNRSSQEYSSPCQSFSNPVYGPKQENIYSDIDPPPYSPPKGDDEFNYSTENIYSQPYDIPRQCLGAEGGPDPTPNLKFPLVPEPIKAQLNYNDYEVPVKSVTKNAVDSLKEETSDAEHEPENDSLQG